MNHFEKLVPPLVLLALLSSTASFAYTDYHGTMNDFMGVNVHQQLWQYHYLGTNVDYDMHIPFRWVRNYHPWEWFEPTNDNYLWNFQGEGQWKWFDEYYRRLNQDSVNILICVLSTPSWVTGGALHPYDNGSGSTENNYREKAEYLAQLAARYGQSGNVAPRNLETSDKVQGLDYCRYFEDDNEENAWWNTEDWPPANYARFMNAVHDGRGVTLDSSLPIAGVKQGDARALHVLGGLANNGIDRTAKCNGSYLDSAVKATGRAANKVMDVINIHLYWNNTDSIPWPWTGAAGVCPENGLFERGNNDIAEIKAWRDSYAPGMEIWLTEFGWDTYTAGGDNHSYQFAPELQQANYILRSFALLKYLGLGKAFVYFDQDPNSASAVQYSSCGLVKDLNNGFSRKTSYYYMSTMRNMIGDYSFVGADKHAVGTPQLYLYRFARSATDNVLMAWCRQAGQRVDNGAAIQNCMITVSGMETCTQVTPQPGLLSGQSTTLTVANQGSATASVTVPHVGETPLFLKITGNGLSSRIRPAESSPTMQPQAHGRAAVLRGIAVASDVAIAQLDGTLAWKSSGLHSGAAQLGLKPGLYVYFVRDRKAHSAACGRFLGVGSNP